MLRRLLKINCIFDAVRPCAINFLQNLSIIVVVVFIIIIADVRIVIEIIQCHRNGPGARHRITAATFCICIRRRRIFEGVRQRLIFRIQFLARKIGHCHVVGIAIAIATAAI